MNHRHGQTRLAAFTLALLIVYAPIETWYSLPKLWDPFYVVDLIGIVLLLVGLVRLRRDPVSPHLPILIAGYAWTSANFWRAFFGRVLEIAGGGELDYGWAELCFTICVLIIALGGLVWSLALNTRHAAPAGYRAPLS